MLELGEESGARISPPQNGARVKLEEQDRASSWDKANGASVTPGCIVSPGGEEIETCPGADFGAVSSPGARVSTGKRVALSIGPSESVDSPSTGAGDNVVSGAGKKSAKSFRMTFEGGA